MDKKEREEFKKSLRIIQGGKQTSRKEIKQKVTKKFEELKIELAKVKDYKYSGIEEAKRVILQYEEEYGIYLEKINPKKHIMELDKMDEKLERLLEIVKEAQIMKRNEMGFEIVED